MAFPTRRETVLEEIKDVLIKQAQMMDRINDDLRLIAGNLEELNTTLDSIRAYLAQIASRL